MKRRCVYLAAAAIFLASGGTWLFTRDTLPKTIRIAAGHQGGMYYHFGLRLKKKLENRTGRQVEILQTAGSTENEVLLHSGKVHFSLLQSGSFPNRNISVAAPLYLEPVVILAKKSAGIASVFDLEGRLVCTGPKASGMANTADMFLNFYGLHVRRAESSFNDSSGWDAAIVTSGLLSPSLQNMVKTGAFSILELPGAKALSQSFAFVSEFTLPAAIFARKPMLPPENLQTVAYTALLAVNTKETSSVLLNEVLDAIYETDLRMEFPMLMPPGEIRNWSDLPLHPTAKEYFNPYGQIDIIANFMQSLAAVKELFVAILAAVYFLWMQLDEYRKKNEKKLIQQMKDQLDEFLHVTIDAERRQMESNSPDELQELINRITAVKLKALEELTDEKLRSDRMFSIFLTQCHNVIAKIQAKREMLQQRACAACRLTPSAAHAAPPP